MFFKMVCWEVVFVGYFFIIIVGCMNEEYIVFEGIVYCFVYDVFMWRSVFVKVYVDDGGIIVNCINDSCCYVFIVFIFVRYSMDRYDFDVIGYIFYIQVIILFCSDNVGYVCIVKCIWAMDIIVVIIMVIRIFIVIGD